MRIVRQPNNNFAVFNSETNDFIILNANFKQLLQFYLTQKAYQLTKEVTEKMKELSDKDEMECLKLWNDCMLEVHNNHGEHRILEIHNKIK